MTDVAQELTSLQNTANSALGTIETALKAEVAAEQLPLIGTAIKDNFDGTKTLLATQSMQSAVDSGIEAAETALGGDANWINDAQQVLDNDINSALQSAGFAGSVGATVDGSGNITLNLANSKTVSDTVPLASNLGLSNLQLTTTGTATASLGYDYNLTLGVNAADDSAFVDAGGSPVLSVSANVSAASLSADAQLGFLNFQATDAGSGLNANIAVNLSGTGQIAAGDLSNAISTIISGNATADFNLISDVADASGQQNPAFPSISANLDAQWTIGSAPTVTINNVSYSFGSFVQDFIDPILAELDPIVKPLQEVLAIFNTDITPLDAFKNVLDVAGGVNALGQDTGDGKVTLLDFVKLAFEAAGQNINLAPFVNFTHLVQDLIDWDAFLQGKNFGPDSYTIGSFNIPISGLPTLIAGTQQDLNSFFAGLPGGGATDNGQTAAQVLQGMFSNADFSFPIITDPLSAIEMLLGQNTNLFQLNLQTSLNFGPGFNADGSPAGALATIAQIPLGIPFLNALMQGDFSAAVNIGFGYDTRGLQEYEQSLQPGQTPIPPIS